jgi:hypothetical protein
LILPENFIELYIVYHYLKLEYGEEVLANAIFHHELEAHIESEIGEFFTQNQDAVLNTNVWICTSDVTKYSGILTKYPNLKNSVILYSRLEYPLEQRKI